LAKKVNLIQNIGFAKKEISELNKLVEENQKLLLDA
jgi:hypothetical protein